MKWLILLFVLPVSALGCGKNQFEYRGECQDDIKPIVAEAVKPSDEVVPDDKMPSWQREGITVIEAQNMAFEDAKMDREKLDADAQGKQAAGIKPR